MDTRVWSFLFSWNRWHLPLIDCFNYASDVDLRAVKLGINNNSNQRIHDYIPGHGNHDVGGILRS